MHIRYPLAYHSYIAHVGTCPQTHKVFFANPAACHLFGYSEDEFKQITRFQLFDQNPEFFKFLNERDKKGKAAAELVCLKKNGEKFCCEVSSAFFSSEAGQLGAINTFVDITDRKKIYRELQESNERFRLATRASFDAIWDYDLVNQTIRWGEGFKILFGYEVSENEFVPFDSWDNNLHPEDKDRVVNRLAHTIENCPDVTFWQDEYRFYRADKSISYVIDRGMIIRDEHGKGLRMVGAMQDITPLKVKEKELTESYNRFRHATQATSDIIWDWDLESDQIKWTKNFSLILGHDLPADQMLPIDFCFRHIHPRDLEGMKSSVEKALKDPRVDHWSYKMGYRKADNTYAYLLDRANILRDENGKAYRMIGAMQDITRIKFNEDVQAMELQVFEKSATPGVTLKETILTLLKGIDNLHPGLVSACGLLNERNKLKELISFGLPAQYINNIKELKIGPKSGSSGTAMYRKEPVIVEDITTDPLWEDFRDLAPSFGYRACWALPIIHHQGQLLGSFAIFLKESRKPTELEWLTLKKSQNLLRILVENDRSYEEMRISNERFNIIAEATHDMVWDWDLTTDHIYRDPKGLKKVYGIEKNEDLDNSDKWLAHIHPEDRDKAQRVVREILTDNGREVFDMEYRFRKADGSYSFVYDRGIIIRDYNNKPYRMIGAAQNITYRKMLEQEIFRVEVQKQKAISQTIIDTQERERADIGRELHDNVNQVLTTTKLFLDMAASDKSKCAEFVKKSSDNIMYVINEIRMLSRSLMLPTLGDLGLLESIYDLAETINQAEKFKVDVHTTPEVEEVLNDEQKLVVYRIIQEAMNNIIKYANAKSVLIHLHHDDQAVFLTVSDDGNGFDMGKVRPGLGLKNIRNRVYLLNGSLETNTSPGKGCEHMITIPLLLNTESVNKL